MARYVSSLILVFLMSAACKTQQPISDSKGNPVPRITWVNGSQDLGDVKMGEKRQLSFEFKNTGSADLLIELVTACQCTTLDWPRSPIPPGGTGVVSALYDSEGQKLGPAHKVIDVIANTDPIVVEAFFDVNVIYQNTYKP